PSYLASLAPTSFPTRRSSDLFQRTELDIDPFLFDQASDVAEQRNVRVLRQSKFALQGEFARALSFQVLERINLREQGISGRVPLDRKSTRLNSSQEWISYAVF